MSDFTALSEPFARSHYLSFDGKVWDLPDGQAAHIYVKPTYHGRYGVIDTQTGRTYPYEGDIDVYAVIGSIFNVADEPVMGIRAYIEPVDNWCSYVYRLDADYGEDDSVVDWLVDVFNGLVEELDAACEPNMAALEQIFANWGLGPYAVD